MADNQNGRVAVYLDFDNIVLSWYDRVHGRNSFGRDRHRIAEDPNDPEIAARLEAAAVDVGAIIDYASSFGTLVLTRAYADWSSQINAQYRTQLVARAIDLVQLFPAAAYAKNGADIRLAVDTVEDMFRLDDLTHVVIVGGDSDYVPLAQRCKRLGRYVVGIGVAGSTAKSLTAACDEFASYDTLPGVERPRREEQPARSGRGRGRAGASRVASAADGNATTDSNDATDVNDAAVSSEAADANEVGTAKRGGAKSAADKGPSGRGTGRGAGGRGAGARVQRGGSDPAGTPSEASEDVPEQAPPQTVPAAKSRSRRSSKPATEAPAPEPAQQAGATQEATPAAAVDEAVGTEHESDLLAARQHSSDMLLSGDYDDFNLHDDSHDEFDDGFDDDSDERTEDSELEITGLLIRALLLGQEKDDSEWLHSSAVKQQMRRMDPSFSEKALGFRSFSDFLKSRSEIAELEETGHERLVRLRDQSN